MKKLLFSLSFLTLICLSFSCGKETSVNDLSFSYKETQCAEPWQLGNYEPGAEAHKTVVSTYLTDSLNIEFEALEIKKENDGAACQACTCENGYVIRLKSSAAFENKLTVFGFVKD